MPCSTFWAVKRLGILGVSNTQHADNLSRAGDERHRHDRLDMQDTHLRILDAMGGNEVVDVDRLPRTEGFGGGRQGVLHAPAVAEKCLRIFPAVRRDHHSLAVCHQAPEQAKLIILPMTDHREQVRQEHVGVQARQSGMGDLELNLQKARLFIVLPFGLPPAWLLTLLRRLQQVRDDRP